MDPIRTNVQKVYGDALERVEGDGLAEGAGYTDEERRHDVISFGCGNPLAFSEVQPGDTVLDLGSGAGLDLILAAERVGPTGRVIGVDMTDAMVAKARENVARAGFADRVDVRWGLIESLPVESASVDWVISNCVVNLSPEKKRVFQQVARVLRPGGRMELSDIVVDGVPPWAMRVASIYSASLTGAVGRDAYVAAIRGSGLTDIDVVAKHTYAGEELRAMAEGFGPEWAHKLLHTPLGTLLARIGDGKATSIRVHARKPEAT